ncbi:hypothetical protein BG004_004573 [Podila humilis]|nr:hypothetical protein BG004_004573 [Podila humilis]
MDQSVTIQRSFRNWLIKNKATFDKLEFREDDDQCGGVYCKSDIEDEEVFLVVPYEPLVITDTLARLHLPKIASKLDFRVTMTLYLIQQRLLGDRSFFQPYLDMVPSRIHTALEFDKEDSEFLRGTNAFLTVQDRKKNLCRKYGETMDVIGAELTPDEYTWEMFLWAETVISSRSFPAHLFGECIEGEMVLIPLADMLNHQSRHKISWLKTPQGLQMSGPAVSKGEQVFSNYGPKDNPDDLVILKPNFSRDPDQDRKTAILKWAGVTDGTLHYLSSGHIPHQLLLTMRVMAMNPTETSQYHAWMEDEEQELIHGHKSPFILKEELQFVTFRNEFAMLDLLDLLLTSKLLTIRKWDAELAEPSNGAQKYALFYRQGQKKILESCSEVIRGMFSALLSASNARDLVREDTVFVGASRGVGLEQRRALASSSFSTNHFIEIALKEGRSMEDLKLDATRQVLLRADAIMIEQKSSSFGKAFKAAFPDHSWGEDRDPELELDDEEEMTIQMEQDAILTCYLIYERVRPDQLSAFIAVAKDIDFSSQLDEDMQQDVLDLRLSLQETLENTDADVFNYKNRFTSKAFLWATGLMEALSLTLHIGEGIATGVFAPTFICGA